MSTVSQRFTKFLSNLQLTGSQIDDAKTKHTGVRTALHNHYYGSHKSAGILYNYAAELRSSYANYDVLAEKLATSTSYLVGSYGKNTAIRPPSDIDILFIMPPSEWSKYNGYWGNGQSRLLQDVKNVLLKSYPNTDIRGDGQVVSVRFTSYAVEVVPAFAVDYVAYYKYPDTSSGGSWRDTDPKAEKTTLSESNKTNNRNTIKLIKMMKKWKKYCNVPLSSFAMELTVVDFLSTYAYSDKSETYYDWMVRDYLEYLIQHKSSSYAIPGISEWLYIGNSWLSRAETAYRRAIKACSYESNNEDRLATVEWKNIFGDDFEY